MKVLIVVDMQNDFITGALGTPEARGIVDRVVEKIKGFDGMVLATRDTHGENYLSSAEGKKLPVPHCIKGTAGWQLCREIERLLVTPPIDKPTFGSAELGQMLSSYNKIKPITEVTLIGVCTDICVISNALLVKAFPARGSRQSGCLLLCGHHPRKPPKSPGGNAGLPDRRGGYLSPSLPRYILRRRCFFEKISSALFHFI